MIGAIIRPQPPLTMTEVNLGTKVFVETLAFTALLNLVALRSLARVELSMCLAANLIGLVYGILIVIVLPEPQSFLALLSYLAVTVGATFSLLVETRRPPR
ncbi:MAG: hypothetical protein KA765_12990 [Thermoflexales bacterium]|nr:hypothetical protein [Thermoflexales bacterium]